MQAEEIRKKYNLDSALQTVRVRHCDVIGNDALTSKMQKTDEGYLVGSAPVAKVGVMPYLMHDGKIVREYVPRETLFDADSMASFKMKPVTDDHPTERKVDVKNANYRQVGFTGETISAIDNYLVVNMTVTDGYAVEHIDDGKQELSPGYEAEIVFQKGTIDGQDYDAIQVSRKYNHLAIVDNARGGADIRMQVDNADTYGYEQVARFHWDEADTSMAAKLDEMLSIEMGDAVLSTEQRKNLSESAFCGPNRSFPVPDCAHVTAARRLIGRYKGPGNKDRILACVNRKAKNMSCDIKDKKDTKPKPKERPMPTFRIDNIDYEAAQEVINFAGKLQNDMATVTKQVKDEQDKVQALTGEKDALKAKVDALEKRDIQKEINDGVKARLELEKIAGVVLEDSAEIEKLDNRGLKVAIIAKKLPDVATKIDEKTTDVYINAVLDSIQASLTEDEKNTLANQRKISTDKQDHKDDKKDSAEEARKKLMKENQDAWKPAENK